MSDPNVSGDTASDPGSTASRPFRFFPFLLVMILLLGLSLMGWQGYEMQQNQSRQAAQLAIIEAGLADIRQLKERQALLSENIALQQANLDRVSQIFAQQGELLATLQQQKLGQKDTARLAETAALVRLAAVSLRVYKDPAEALDLLKKADQILRSARSVAMLNLREVIAGDIANLEAASVIDRAGLYLQLVALIDKTAAQPFKVLEGEVLMPAAPAVAPAPVDEDVWAQIDRFWQALWHRLSHLVDFRVGQPAPTPMLTALDQQLIRQRIVLDLTSAQYALLARDEIIYQSALGQVSENLELHFDLTGSDGRWLLQTLSMLTAQSLEVALPDLDASMSAIDVAYDKIEETQ
jgi:uroporphyrin-3 C-methyltransferase